MTNLTNNTASLEALLTKANALPDKSDGIDTSDATITPETVFLNETGYANGQKVTGTFTIEDEVTAQENLISQISAALEGKAAGGGGGNASGSGNNTVTITTESMNDSVYYFDSNGTQQVMGGYSTYEVLSGIFWADYNISVAMESNNELTEVSIANGNGIIWLVTEPSTISYW